MRTWLYIFNCDFTEEIQSLLFLLSYISLWIPSWLKLALIIWHVSSFKGLFFALWLFFCLLISRGYILRPLSILSLIILLNIILLELMQRPQLSSLGAKLSYHSPGKKQSVSNKISIIPQVHVPMWKRFLKVNTVEKWFYLLHQDVSQHREAMYGCSEGLVLSPRKGNQPLDLQHSNLSIVLIPANQCLQTDSFLKCSFYSEVCNSWLFHPTSLFPETMTLRYNISWINV